MSPCSRGAISRTLRLNVLRLNSKTFSRQPSQPILSNALSIAPANTFSAWRQYHQRQCRRLSTTTRRLEHAPSEHITDSLPLCCPGCGAFSQTIEPNEPGYYSTNRKQIRKLLAAQKDTVESNDTGADETVAADESSSADASNEATDGTTIPGSLGTLSNPQGFVDSGQVPDREKDAALPDEAASDNNPESSKQITEVCDRCHDLIHHNKAVAAPKPSVFSIREFLDESPYKHNRIYHILDAADFPMSLVPRIHSALSVQEQRSRNRRSSTEKFSKGKRLPTVSFIITRSDLLAATKEQVDSKMLYIRSVLRTALGKTAENARLGNVHMISPHRGWWTKEVKEEIREHGGGIWVVGKANVGKSSFIKTCFPKDSRSLEKMDEWMERFREEHEIQNKRQASLLDPDSLLPPAPREEMYPLLPVVSSLPGTTVSPIRIPFGRGKGEVIDLPGLERGQMEDYVRDEHKRDLIMTKRIKPERCTIKPGQSLLLGGGLIRITPLNPEDTLLAACFVPIETHITRTDKAIEMQTEKRAYPGTNLLKEGVGASISSAGIFDLQWDTTKSNMPTRFTKALKDRREKPPPLWYRVMAADILIEGCGWIEVSVQVRAKHLENDGKVPQIEVFTPNGRHIGLRPPMECYSFVAEKIQKDRRKRPRLILRYKK